MKNNVSWLCHFRFLWRRWGPHAARQNLSFSAEQRSERINRSLLRQPDFNQSFPRCEMSRFKFWLWSSGHCESFRITRQNDLIVFKSQTIFMFLVSAFKRSARCTYLKIVTKLHLNLYTKTSKQEQSNNSGNKQTSKFFYFFLFLFFLLLIL